MFQKMAGAMKMQICKIGKIMTMEMMVGMIIIRMMDGRIMRKMVGMMIKAVIK